MTTVVVVRKGMQLALASDSLVTFGDTRLAHGYEENEKLFRVGDSWIGMAGTTAHFPVLRRVLNSLPPDELKLRSRDEVFDTFLKVHPKLKETFFLNPKEEDADPYESSQFTALIANATGIYGVYSYREVFEFDRFWAIGSGRAFALGAMYGAYGGKLTAREIAELGVRAGCEFDKNSAGPIKAHTIKLKAKD
ncbi:MULTISPECIES: MFS transporter [unclassified Rhizobacter]|uniref:MFS transporter n=1 Tax=unclassified Rhizobacter TaxID=2640088 RepID=UPI0006FCC2DA|nr:MULTISPECIES: MFS transporter [unclassified Rhizobacter]KQU81674.1 MFS transporter [Rhizobacter sp. Root29]KQW01639.1 MFS transporter [Rhizobacter sp. Root1238]KRB18535.1 MFS transporter [Rhizobacter sp. Root16D2]NKI92659.1 ATP-dependent protease HslVU (ClpYQ) peptidase subunit [Rhizobacter sp. SG703]